jgi:hypothetical protein
MTAARRSLTATTTLAVVAAGLALSAVAQDIAPPKATKEHGLLKKDAGVWDARVKIWMKGPDGPPDTSDMVETVRLLPGGLWAVTDVRGNLAGGPFRGNGHYGYDPAKKKYVGSWVDTMGPALTTSEATYDEATKTLTTESATTDEDGKPMRFREVCVYGDDGTRTITMTMQSAETGDKPIKFMERVCTKRPTPAKKAAPKNDN